jgi:hypothetical protein
MVGLRLYTCSSDIDQSLLHWIIVLGEICNLDMLDGFVFISTNKIGNQLNN